MVPLIPILVFPSCLFLLRSPPDKLLTLKSLDHSSWKLNDGRLNKFEMFVPREALRSEANPLSAIHPFSHLLLVLTLIHPRPAHLPSLSCLRAGCGGIYFSWLISRPHSSPVTDVAKQILAFLGSRMTLACSGLIILILFACCQEDSDWTLLHFSWILLRVSVYLLVGLYALCQIMYWRVQNATLPWWGNASGFPEGGSFSLGWSSGSCPISRGRTTEEAQKWSFWWLVNY